VVLEFIKGSFNSDSFYIKKLIVIRTTTSNSNQGVFTLDVKSMLNENLGGILGGTPMLNGS
jgi:hypothetical protein